MKCSWCGTQTKHDQSIHDGCMDAKRRVEEVGRNPRQLRKKKAHVAAARSTWSSEGSYYRTKLADFKKRMAKRGIKI